MIASIVIFAALENITGLVETILCFNHEMRAKLLIFVNEVILFRGQPSGFNKERASRLWNVPMLAFGTYIAAILFLPMW
jgi:hypothetical protein